MIYRFIILLFSVILLYGCDAEQTVEFTKVINGNNLRIVVPAGDVDKGKCVELFNESSKIFSERISKLLAGEGFINRINRQRGPVEVTPDIVELMQHLAEYENKTDNCWNPFAGGIRKVWGIDTPTPAAPDAETLSRSTAEASETKLSLLAGNRLKLEGSGLLYLGRTALGWAVDGAAEVMMNGGVKAGYVYAEDVYRSWGDPLPEEMSVIDVPATGVDGVGYKILPAAGGICAVRSDEKNILIDGKEFVGIFDPQSGLPVEALDILTAWAPDAVRACLYAEAMYSMANGKRNRWVEVSDSVEVFLIQTESIGKFGVTSSGMSNWVSSYLP